jgi:hypothetical protein
MSVDKFKKFLNPLLTSWEATKLTEIRDYYSAIKQFQEETRPFKCNICIKAFKRKSDFLRYQLTHQDGECPYPCN